MRGDYHSKGTEEHLDQLFDVIIKHYEAIHQNLNYTISGYTRVNGSRHAWIVLFGVIDIVEGPSNTWTFISIVSGLKNVLGLHYLCYKHSEGTWTIPFGVANKRVN